MRRIVVLLCLLVTAPLMASEGLPDGYWFELTAKVVNAGAFFGLLFWLLRKPIAGMIQSGREELERKLKEAEEKEQLADKRLQEIDARMAGLESEVRELLEKTDQAANREKETIIAKAREEADKIRHNAQREIENRFRVARLELQAYMTDLALEKAEDLIREHMTGKDVEKSMDRFIEELER